MYFFKGTMTQNALTKKDLFGSISLSEAKLHLNKICFHDSSLSDVLCQIQQNYFKDKFYDPNSNEIGWAPWYGVDKASPFLSSSPHCPFRLLIWN